LLSESPPLARPAKPALPALPPTPYSTHSAALIWGRGGAVKLFLIKSPLKMLFFGKIYEVQKDSLGIFVEIDV
jgi:hypothetical protein